MSWASASTPSSSTSPTPTALEEAQRRIRAYAAANPTPRWIVGRGWNQERWGRAASRPRPISTPSSATGRSGWSGSTAMPAGPTARRCARPGSRRVRRPGRPDRADRPAPSGIFVDAAMALVERAVPAAAAGAARQRLAGAGDLAVERPHHRRRHGHERRDWAAMRRAGDAGQLRVRILSYASGIDNLLAIAGSGRRPGSMTAGCAWSASSSTSTARWARAAPG